MSKETREHISSLMDGEISRDASRFLVRRLGADEELGATWARYHMVRDCLRDPDGGLASRGLSLRISAAIESESPPVVRRLAVGWLKPVAGVAIAASVALMAVMAVGTNTPLDQPLPGGELAGTADAPFSSPQGISESPVTTPAASKSNPSVDRYLLRHYQAAGVNNGRGFVGFVPLVVARKAAPAAEFENETEAAQEQQATETPGAQ